MLVWLLYMQRDMTDRMWKGQYSCDYSLVTREDVPATPLFQFTTRIAHFCQQHKKNVFNTFADPFFQET